MKLLSVVLVSLFAICDGLKFDCSYHNTGWSYSIIRYPCGTSTFAFGDNAILLLVEGEHLSGKSGVDVEALEVSDNNLLLTIPRGIENFFPNLKGMSWISNTLTTLSADDLEPFPQLLVFAVQSAKVTSIESDFFRFTPKLLHINLSATTLKHVGFDLLTDLADLEWANFLNNACINEIAYSADEIPIMITKLRLQCPYGGMSTESSTISSDSTDSTTISSQPEECSFGCLKKIEILEAENKQMRNELADLNDKIEELNDFISKYEGRMVDLERMIREL